MNKAKKLFRRIFVAGLIFSIMLVFVSWKDSTGTNQGNELYASPESNPKANTSIKTNCGQPWVKTMPTAKRIFFVSPNGTGDGNTRTTPTSLTTIIKSCQPGDLIWLLSGTYTGVFNINRNGTASSPIIYRSYPGEHAKVVGGLKITGDHSWVWGLEVTDPNDTAEGDIVYSAAEGTVLINNVLHPEGYNTGIGSWDKPGQIVYGNIVYHGHHNIYTQNTGANGLRWFVDNISMDAKTNSNGGNGPYEFHAYAEGGNISGFRLRGNVFANTTVIENSVNGTMLIGGKNKTANEDIEIESNFYYNTDLAVGYKRPIQAIVKKNFIVDSQLIYEKFWGKGEAKFPEPAQIIVTDNKMYWYRKLVSHVRLHTSAYRPDSNSDTGFSRIDKILPFREKDIWDLNTYSPSFLGEMEAGNVFTNYLIKTIDDWRKYTKQAGNEFDKNGKVVPMPTNPVVFLTPNDYETGRGHVIVYGFGNAKSVSVDLSSTVKVGSYYEIRRVKDAFGKPVVSGVYKGGSVSLPIEKNSTGSIFSAYLLTSK